LDYYQILRVAPNASRKEIEQAYQKLLKESRYDTSIDRLQIENAYRILSDLGSKNRYDTRQSLKSKRSDRAQKMRLRKIRAMGSVGIFGWIQRRTLPQLLATLAVVLTIAVIFYSVRYGYLLREFHAGDILYDTLTNEKFGKVLKVEVNHDFGSKKADAYQIELNPGVKRFNKSAKIVWLTKDTVKRRCYKEE
jgi:curved DNA-binding protein CbpA